MAREFWSDGPEPPEDVRKLRCARGAEMERMPGGGWWWTKDIDGAATILPSDGEGWPWSSLPIVVDTILLTEVDE